ncbi:MAG: type I-U CRISPR-associated protein Cas7 [Pseudonocardiales bacterium]|nr:type I-U CRISPR-associated protein Cas7 [Pseudonocardiales bacterium]MBV9728198.1 type I-U CRISPR-associated protein Cas7 [Pseudonocardiales bacterium]
MITRLSFDVELAPLLGSTFQPTGFPDVGPATFIRFENGQEVPSLLVESVQSMANRLEATAWEAASDEPVAEVAGLPYVRVVRAGSGEFLTSSRLEAHRLASPFVHRATRGGKLMFDDIRDRLGLAKDTPLNRRHMARAVAELDPFCLLHGVFFSHKQWWGQPKFERAISAVIEARDVQRAVSGGRKSDRVRHQLGEEGGGTAEGYGSVPFHRTEWTAKTIRASFVVDAELLRSYGLPQPVTELLQALALWEIHRFLAGGLRLRTACDLEMVGEVSSRHNSTLPELDELTSRIAELIHQGRDVFGEGTPLTVEWSGKKA